MIIKLPACYDVSHWKEIKDFKLVTPKPLIFITKATEACPGTVYRHTDEKFIRYFTGMMEINCIRGAFHFHRKSVDTVRQANHFVETISKVDILPTDLLILDVEEGGEKASQLWIWNEVVKDAYPDNIRMIYSRKNILDAISMTYAEKEYFKEIPIWTAGYPYSPDLFSDVPRMYIPDQTKYGITYLWQYSAHGRVQGITTEAGQPTDVDLNLIAPLFLAMLPQIITGEKIMANYEGRANQTAKVWSTIGGARVYPDVTANQSIKANAEQVASGIRYLHLTSPIIGWSKAEWFTYHEVTTEPPPPTPEPETEYILHVKDGIARKFIPE